MQINKIKTERQVINSKDPRGIQGYEGNISKEIEFIKNFPTKEVWSQGGFIGEFYQTVME